MIVEVASPVAIAARAGLLATPKTLPPWLFYDERGSQLFLEITALPEYYLTRVERSLLSEYADEILRALDGPITIAELGAGTASKTGILLQAAARLQHAVLYQPIDVSPSALEEGRENITAHIVGVTVRTRIANYVTEPIRIERPRGHKILALYIGSSVGNFSRAQARSILSNVRSQLRPGDALLLGADFAPGPRKPVEALLVAYNDKAGVTAAFNLNILARLNKELGSNFDLNSFSHEARWNAEQSRIEMHLVSLCRQQVSIPDDPSGAACIVNFALGETIHTENSYKFTRGRIAELLGATGFEPMRTFTDPDERFGVTLAQAT